MRLLILGGTQFLGRHLVDAALARDHEVVLFTRGKTNPQLYPELQKLRGDRDGDLSALDNQTFDAVIDTSGYIPRVVRASAEILRDSVQLYVFVSSVSVYSDLSESGVDELAPVMQLEDETSEDVDRNYGALKARCEETIRDVFPDRALVVRPGLIVGPHDPTNRFTYWVTRTARGGRVLAPAPSDRLVQFIDVRDLAQWMILMIESNRTGTFNAACPPLSFGEVIDACIAAADVEATIKWVDSAFLMDAGVGPWMELPLWIPEDHDLKGFMAIDSSQALAAGLTMRPVQETVNAIHDWTRRLKELPGEAGLTPERERELLALVDQAKKEEVHRSS
jgi:2'-hydroxyisoflavone reductase